MSRQSFLQGCMRVFGRMLGLSLTCMLILDPVWATRLKDIADIEGVRSNQLLGYGVVVGLNGTGDGNQVDFTTKSLSNLLQNLGVQIAPDDINVRNTAAVMVTADLPPFVRPGSKIDVTISSLGDAQSLLGGTLLFTPLKGADGNVYAIAQGSVSVGGFSVSGDTDSVTQNHPTVGVMAGGATVERAIPFDLFRSTNLRVVLRQPDFTTMDRLVRNINRNFGGQIATSLNSASLEIEISPEMREDPVAFVSRLEQVEIVQDMGARVVVNERSGTIVMGEEVRVSRVALAHGNLSIAIRTDNQVSQPPALSPGGQTTVLSNTEVQVAEDTNRLSLVGGEVTLGEVVEALNALGATPRDLISIFSALKRAGALHADLVIM
jgi:flagellar P-ring protein precursor FlgI